MKDGEFEMGPGTVVAIRQPRQPMVHFIKCWPDFFGDVYDGGRPFEIRRNDRDYRVGDQVIIQEWEPKTQTYTGRCIDWIIGYITEGVAGLDPDYCVISPSVGKLNVDALKLLEDLRDYLDFGPTTVIMHNSDLHNKICAFLNKNQAAK